MLRGSTLVETIVASMLFLILFFLAMEMLVRIGARRPGEGLLQMEVDHRVCVQEFRAGDFAPGEYTRSYTWGEITVTVGPYRDLPGIEEVRFTTRLETCL